VPAKQAFGRCLISDVSHKERIKRMVTRISPISPRLLRCPALRRRCSAVIHCANVTFERKIVVGLEEIRAISFGCHQCKSVSRFRLTTSAIFPPLNPSVFTFENERIVTGAKVTENACGRIQFGEKSGGETAILTVGANLPVQTAHQLRKRPAGTREGSQAGLKSGHQHRRRHALSTNVSHGD
jgi:hypothetical protein